jgi:hypothetical protein
MEEIQGLYFVIFINIAFMFYDLIKWIPSLPLPCFVTEVRIGIATFTEKLLAIILEGILFEL